MQDLYLFNPDNEISIANGTNGYTPKANISIMAGDLAFLSAYLTGKGDYVLVTKMPDFDFMKSRKEIFVWIVNRSSGKKLNYFLLTR